jgi:predicted ATPase
MKHVMPTLEHVTVKQIGGYVVPQFLVKDTPKEKAHFFDPVQLSDGTLRLFAIFLSLYQIPRPDFLALEEPELTIHPGLVNLLAEAFQEVSERTQILITTHSPYLLDHFDPLQIKVVTMQEGKTKVSSIRRSQIETVKEKLMMLSEVMALDGLRPE